MKKRVLIATAVAIVTLALIGKPVIEQQALDFVRKQVKENCPVCKFEIEEVKIGFFVLNGNKISFSAGTKDNMKIEIEVPRVSFTFGKTARLHSPKITLTDGPKELGALKQGESSGLSLIRKIQVLDGEFTYVRDVKGTHAVLPFQEFNVDFYPGDKRAQASGSIGKNDKFKIDTEFGYADKELFVNVEMALENLDLADLTRFFEPNAGVVLKGKIVKGRASSKLRGETLKSSLQAQYDGFDIKVKKMYDRDELVAFFTNLGIAIATKEKNKGDSKKEQTGDVELKKEGKESIVQFILRGLKESALKVAI